MRERMDRSLLTETQDKVLEAVLVLTKKNGWPPTLDEIGAHCGLASKSSVWAHLEYLQAKGWIKRGPGPRAIRIMEGGENL